MFTDAKLGARISAIAQRVLIADAQPASTRLLGDLLRSLCHCQIWTASDPGQALALAERVDPFLIFVGQSSGFDGVAFTRRVRRGDLSCRKAAMVMISTEATAGAILAARDAGVHELLRKPFTLEDLARRLEAVASRPRDWIEGVGYVGPDRRRFNSGGYSDLLRRRVDHAVTASEARVGQALRMLQAAMLAVDSDPRQALRSMIAQADEIGAVATSQGDDELALSATAQALASNAPHFCWSVSRVSASSAARFLAMSAA